MNVWSFRDLKNSNFLKCFELKTQFKEKFIMFMGECAT